MFKIRYFYYNGEDGFIEGSADGLINFLISFRYQYTSAHDGPYIEKFYNPSGELSVIKVIFGQYHYDKKSIVGGNEYELYL
jgi:hypothetical protein